MRWETASDWQDAADRRRVTTQDYSTTTPDQFKLGWDVDHPPVSDTWGNIRAYWTFNEWGDRAENVAPTYDWADFGDLTAYGSNVTPGARGPLGSRAWHYNGVDSNTKVWWDEDPTSTASITVVAFIDNEYQSDPGTIAAKGGREKPGSWYLDIRGNNCRIGFAFRDEWGNFVGSDYWHRGKASDYEGPHIIIATFSQEHERMGVYLDGEYEEKDVIGWRSPLEGEYRAPFGIGRRVTGRYPFKGVIGDVLLWSTRIDHDLALELSRTVEDGYLETKPQSPEYLDEES